MKRPCTIVLPCYNEASRFPFETFVSFAAANPTIQFLLVNDGSEDNTAEVLRRTCAGREEQVEFLDRPVNAGKGEAVRVGVLAAIERADCQYVGFWDADLATPLEAIKELTAVLNETPQLAMVFGARVQLLGRRIERRAIRHYLGRIFATVVSTALRLPIYDTQCGAKIFRVGGETRELFATQFCTRWVFDVEILARFIRLKDYDIETVKSSIYEFPLRQWRDVAGSRVRPRDFFRAFIDVLKIYQRYRP